VTKLRQRQVEWSMVVGWALAVVAVVSATARGGASGGKATVRGDAAGEAVLKSAKWRASLQFKSQPRWVTQSAMGVAPGGGPIIVAASGTITALDRATGKLMWSAEGGGRLLGVGEKAILSTKSRRNGDVTETQLIGLS